MKVFQNIDLNKNQLLNARLHNNSSAPSSPSTGQVYFDTTSGRGFVYNGSAWQALGFAQTISFSYAGNLATGTGTFRWYNRTGARTIVGSWASAATAPATQAAIFDVNKNGTTIYTTQGNRPQVAAAGNGGALTAAPDVTSLADGDYLTIDIDQIGTGTVGADAVVGVLLV